jgi:hypothetical protein
VETPEFQQVCGSDDWAVGAAGVRARVPERLYQHLEQIFPKLSESHQALLISKTTCLIVDNSNQVDEFVRSRVLPQYHGIVAMIRELMREMAPNANELISYGIPAWKCNKILAVISPTKKDITFSFSRGAEFKDKYGLLQGVGKISKYVKIKSLDEVNKEALKYYVKQALEFDAK